MLPPKGMHQLMRRIEEFKRLEDDCLSGKGKAPATSPYRKEYYPDRFQQKAIRKPKASVQDPSAASKELIWLLKSLFTKSSNAFRMSNNLNGQVW